MSLFFDAALASRGFEVSFEVETGSHVAVLGANGAGKSTLLQILAGTLVPDRGRFELDGRILFDVGEGRRTWVGPRERNVGVLSQDPLLFPHMDSLDNVAFSPRSRGMGRAEAKQAALAWLERTEAAQFATRKPRSLSGGQAQRVAVARALASEPKLVLLDEPMAPVDAGAAPNLRRMLRDVLRDKTTLVVTHNVLDALILSDRAIVLDRGKGVQSGPTQQVLNHPKTAFAATLAGVNLIEGRWSEGALVTAAGDIRLHAVPEGSPPEERAAVAATFPPSAVSVYEEPSAGSPRNSLAVKITRIEPSASAVLVEAVAHGGTEISALVTPSAVADLDLHPEKRVWFVVKATSLTVFPL